MTGPPELVTNETGVDAALNPPESVATAVNE
jgi:hypothetical protein